MDRRRWWECHIKQHRHDAEDGTAASRGWWGWHSGQQSIVSVAHRTTEDGEHGTEDSRAWCGLQKSHQ